jgi:hypothetical protein
MLSLLSIILFTTAATYHNTVLFRHIQDPVANKNLAVSVLSVSGGRYMAYLSYHSKMNLAV